MTLVKRNSNGMNHFNNDIFSVMNNFFNDDFYNMNNTFKPAVNIQENDDAFEMQIEAPGFNKEDFQINFENGRLEISAEVKNENNEEKDNFIRREFSSRSFTRNFSIKDNIVNSDKIKASYTNGILNLSLPKREEAKPKPAIKIAIS